MTKRGYRVRAMCICCRGTSAIVVYGPSVWKVELICHRCNVGACGKAERHGIDGIDGLDVDTWLRKYGCRSREGEPIMRYRGRR